MPRWTPEPIGPDRDGTAAPTRRVVVLHEAVGFARDAIERRDPTVRCVTVTSRRKRLDAWFRDVTGQYLEIVRELAADDHRGRTLVQAVVPAHGSQAVAFALTGLMRTATLEAPNSWARSSGSRSSRSRTAS